MRAFRKAIGCAAMVSALLASAGAGAQEAAEDSEELLNLLMILEEQTEIATKTKLNADYVPGMVTVLHGDDLEARGVATVWDALRLVPGMELTMDRIGERSVTVRGVGVSALSGKVKILLDDVAMNASFNAMGLPVLELPVEQVARIEVIRGPGSAIHGEFAFAGVVNVISRKEGERAHLRFGENGSRQVGAQGDWVSPSGEVRLSANVALNTTDGEGGFVPSDALLGAMQSGVSSAPGTTDESEAYRSALFNLQYKDFSLLAQWLREERGPFFGVLNVLPRAGSPEEAAATEFTNLEARYRLNLSEEMELALKAGWQRYEQDTDANYLPDGYMFPHILFPGAISYPNGWDAVAGYEERRAYAGADLSWRVSERHTLLAGLSVADIEVEESWNEANIHPTLLVPLPAPMRFDDATLPGTSRDITSLTLQDEFRYNEDVTFTAGLRYDDYSDVGSNLSPRLAAVWRIDRGNILKAQYAEAFRPPTLFEMARSPNVEPETIQSLEVGYVRRFAEGVGRVTLFHSELDDLIYENNLARYFNAPGVVRTRGVELELERQLGDELKLTANLSLDEATDDDAAWAAQVLAGVGLIYQPTSDRTLSLQWNHVGDRGREAADARGDLDGYDTVDLTGSVRGLFGGGVTLRLGINNLFDDDVRYPAGLTGDLLGNVFASYQDDYPRPGRYVWAQLSAEF